MTLYLNGSFARNVGPPRIALVGAPETRPGELERLLEPSFALRRLAPLDVLQRAPEHRGAFLADAAAALIIWDAHTPSVLLALQEAARRQRIPLLALCHPDPAQQVAALVLGADDVLPHPLDPTLLQARLLAFHRRAPVDRNPRNLHELPRHAPPDDHDCLCAGPLTLDRTARRCFVFQHPLRLTAREFDLLAFLIEHAGACHARDALLEQVWGIAYDTETNILDVQVYNLRRKLRAHGVRGLIETVRGVGYRLVIPASPREERVTQEASWR